QFLFAAVSKLLQLLWLRIVYFHRLIFPDLFIDRLFNLPEFFLPDHSVNINGDHVSAHMESHVVVSISPMDHAADHMLSGMLLHQIEPALPVDFSHYFCSRLQRPVCLMKDLTIFFVDLPHNILIECTCI